MAHASRSIVIAVTPEQLFDLIADYRKYPEFLPEVKKTTVEGDGPDATVHYEVDIKATLIKYTLKHRSQRPARLEWEMTKGQMMKENKGAWTLKAVPGGTEATYSIELKLGALVPSFIEKVLAETSLPGLLSNFKARAEKLHPKASA